MISIPRISSGCVIKKSRIFLLCFIGIFWHVRLVTSADDKLGKVRCTNDSSGIPQCTCPEEPITERYRDTSDSTCEFYYLCHLGRAMKRKCFPYYAFHPELQECLPRNRIPSNICKPLVQCPLRPNRYVEDQKDCSKYYLCMFGRPSHWSCPENSFFEPSQEKCVNDEMQAGACVELAKRNYFKALGLEKDPPKSSVAYDKARAYLQEKNKQSTQKG